MRSPPRTCVATRCGSMDLHRCIAVTRAIQRLLQDELAQKILTGQFKPGDTIYADRDGDKLRIGQVAFEQGKKSA